MLMPDKVFGPQATTVEVYDVAAKPVVKAAMEGVNGKEVRLRYQLKWTLIAGKFLRLCWQLGRYRFRLWCYKQWKDTYNACKFSQCGLYSYMLRKISYKDRVI